MNNSGINYLINKNFITDTGNFKIFYDFNSYFQNGNNYFLNSVESGNQNFSGQIFYYNENINTKELTNLILDPSRDEYITKTGEINILGQRINETGFANSYIKILNSENLYNNSDFTFIFEGGKMSKSDLKNIYNYTGFEEQLVIRDKEIIFSNISGSGNNYNGWEIGLNSANLLYFRTNDNYTEKILTFDKVLPPSENIWAVSYINKNIYISRFNPENNNLDINTTKLITDLKNSNEWYIGSGNNSDINIYDTGNCNIYTSSIKLKKFLYFSEYLSQNQILQAIKYLKSDLEINYNIIYQETGYYPSGYEVYYERTGIVGYTTVFSGYLTETITVSGDPVYTALSGQITICDGNSGNFQNFSNTGSTGEFIPFVTGDLISGNDVYKINSTNYSLIYKNKSEDAQYPIFIEDNILNTGGTITPLSLLENIKILSCETVNVITGYNISYNVSGYDINTPVYFQSGITGIIDSGIYTLYSGIESGISFGEYSYSITGENYDNLYAKSICYFGKRNQYDFIELNKNNDIKDNDIILRNYNTARIESNFNDGASFYIDTGLYNINKYRFYLNGIAIRNGTGESYKIVKDNREQIKFNFEKDYLITGNEFVISEILFTGINQVSNMYGILDINDSEVITQELLIKNLDEYDSGIFNNINPSGKDIFFNGIKIYEGENYININNNFAPIGYLTGITGIYFAWSKLSAEYTYTGNEVYDFEFTGNNFIKNNSVATWINGIRKNEKEFIYYDVGINLITGVYVYLDNGDYILEGKMEI